MAGIDVVHAIPGRARVRIQALRGNPVVARRLQERLALLPGMRRVEANPVTGTLLLLYDADDVRWLEELPEAAGTPQLDLGSVRPRLEAGPADGGNGGRPATQVAAFSRVQTSRPVYSGSWIFLPWTRSINRAIASLPISNGRCPT